MDPVAAKYIGAGIACIGMGGAGAGVGERVLVIDEGNSGRQLVARPDAPVKTVIVGVVDYVELDGALVYDSRAEPVE